MFITSCRQVRAPFALVVLLTGTFLVDETTGQDSTITTARELVQFRRQLDESVWSSEVQAQLHEDTFVRLWDKLIHQTDKFEVLRGFVFDQIVLAESGTTKELDHAIQVIRSSGSTRTLTREQFFAMLAEYEQSGYELIETEFHHQAFEPQTPQANARSTVSVLLHVARPSTTERFVVRGDLAISWQRSPLDQQQKVPESIDATGLTIYARQGTPAYETARVENFQCDQSGRTNPTTIHPVLVRDLNRDGLPEVIAAGFNRVYWNKGDWEFNPQQLCDFPVRHPNAGVMADFDGDGVDDFIVAGKNDFVHFLKGAPGGLFPHPGVPVREIGKLRIPVSVAAGDINGDGSLDLFVGQQKTGYQNGEIPTPYYDAADSFPSYVLLNDGSGRFRNATPFAGLGRKAMRRNFSASFVDLDNDADLDLLLTSDFWGTDLFLNDGQGSFSDATDSLQPLGYAFGMSHSFGDYDLDGQLDFITIGMSSTTARRLEKLKLGREEFPDYNEARMKMGYGNRLFLRRGNGFQQAEFNDTCARTGWSWGSTTLDFDRDGDQDLYIVNGQTSGKTTKDYCTRFWCHDIYYKEGQRPDKAIQELFGNMQPLFSGNAISWNGYEHNALLMNLDGTGFVNVGFLMNCSFEFDSRAAISADLDADGRIDLIVENRDIRTDQRNLYFVKNRWEDTNHWIGIRLQTGLQSKSSPLGAKVTVTLADGRKLLQHCVAGHSVWAQHPDTIHFGLGASADVSRVEVTWPNGVTTVLSEPDLDVYHLVTGDAQ